MSRLCIYTNNPLIEKALPEIEVFYDTSSVLDLLKKVRKKMIYEDGYQLLNHPLGGSQQVKNSPYMSLIVKRPRGEGHKVRCARDDVEAEREKESIIYMDTSLLYVEKRGRFIEEYDEETLKDFQYVDQAMIVECVRSLFVDL